MGKREEKRRTMQTAFCYYESPLGLIRIEEDPDGITALTWTDQTANDEIPSGGGKFLRDASLQLEEYFTRRRTRFDLPLSIQGTAFQRQVWAALRTIPYGETRSYQQIAEAVGNGKATRAVGMANNRNPIAILIPCHRVIGKNGALTGYAGGIDRKEKLLELERISVMADANLKFASPRRVNAPERSFPWR